MKTSIYAAPAVKGLKSEKIIRVTLSVYRGKPADWRWRGGVPQLESSRADGGHPVQPVRSDRLAQDKTRLQQPWRRQHTEHIRHQVPKSRWASSQAPKPIKHETLNRCWCNVGPASQTMGQHYPNTGSTSRVCWVSTPIPPPPPSTVKCRAVGWVWKFELLLLQFESHQNTLLHCRGVGWVWSDSYSVCWVGGGGKFDFYLHIKPYQDQ